jgi:hypothetical protein
MGWTSYLQELYRNSVINDEVACSEMIIFYKILVENFKLRDLIGDGCLIWE